MTVDGLAQKYGDAIKRLRKQREPVTVRSVLDEAGGGSFRDAAPVVRAWRNKHEAAIRTGQLYKFLHILNKLVVEGKAETNKHRAAYAPHAALGVFLRIEALLKSMKAGQVDESIGSKDYILP